MHVDVINLILLSVCCLILGYVVEVCHIPCPLDCKLSDWSTWSGCSASCGSGLQMRSKWLREKAFNGGRPCPRLDLKNQASCAAARLLLRHVSLPTYCCLWCYCLFIISFSSLRTSQTIISLYSVRAIYISKSVHHAGTNMADQLIHLHCSPATYLSVSRETDKWG